MLGLTAHTAKATRATAIAHPVVARASGNPMMRHRPAISPRTNWPQSDVATHYFDASSHTAVTLRMVMDSHEKPGQRLGKSNEKLLVNTVNTLVSATCPQGDMDSESHAYFSLLLNLHLSGLEPEELKSLARSLKSAGYDGVSDQAALQHDIYDQFGFITGKPQDVATLPSDWHHLLDDAIEHTASIARRPLVGKPPGDTEARAARQCLLEVALRWPVSGRSVEDIVAIARVLSDAIGLSPAPSVGCMGTIAQRGSMVDWKGDTLLIDPKAFRAMADDTGEDFFAEVLRDLFELLLTRKMAGDTAHPSRLCAADRTRLNKAMDVVFAAEPCAPEAALRQAAKRVMSTAGSMGKVQILPTVGVALGHASVGSTLSVVPDKSKPPLNIGTRYMHPGFQLEPDDYPVMQWPIRWLDANENAQLFAEDHAWQVTVPVDRQRLEHAATEVADEWKAEGKPYRFIGTAPGQASTGCRASVLQAIERGMDDDARGLFAYFNAGLPAPESPTELALRMGRFMNWLQTLAKYPSKE